MPKKDYSTQETQAFVNEVQKLAAEYGYPQIVLVAHNCKKNKLIVIGPDNACGLMNSMHGACYGIQQASGTITSHSGMSDN